MATWDGGHEERIWSTYRLLILHGPGRDPETPWRRSAIGFDTLDHVLDVLVAPDRRSWELKDEDELTWATEQGRFTADQTRRSSALDDPWL